MRLKQLLGVGLLLVASCAMVVSGAWAAPMSAPGSGEAHPSQLAEVNVAANGNVTTVILRTSGIFTHNEYRPTDGLLLVDLAGVSPAQFAGAMKDLHVPGVSSYHVLSYNGTAGAEITRVELALLPGSMVKISDVGGGVAVQVTANAFTPVAAERAAAKPEAPSQKVQQADAQPKPVAPRESAASPSGRVTVESVAVTRGHDGLQVEITGSGAMAPKAMKLTGPDRLVIDVANAVPARSAHTIAVNSEEVKSVRVGQFQDRPPVTRVVVDLAMSRDYELVPAGNKILVKFHGPTGATATPATPQQPVTLAQNPAPAAAKPVAATPAPVEQKPIELAQSTPPVKPPAVKQDSRMPVLAPLAIRMPERSADFVIADLKYQPKSGPSEAQPPAKPAESPAAQAAAKFGSGEPKPAFVTYGTSAAMSPKVVSAAMQQPAPPAQPAQVSSAPQSCVHDRYTGEPVSVNLKDVDVKDFFRLVHEISGLNIVLDPNVRGSLTLVLDDVPWDQALVIVLQNNGLDCQISGNVLRIATVETLRHEAEAARAKDEAQALAVTPTNYTHYLSYAHAKEVLPTVKKFLTARGDVIADDRTNSLIIQDIPSVIPRVQQLLVQLDRKTQEVEIEARVVAANRNFARDIGTQLGFGTGGNTFAVGGAGVVGQSPLVATGLTPNYITLGNSIPLFSNQAAAGATSGISLINATNNYRLDFILTAAETRGLVKILSRPRVITQNNVQANIRQGSQIPVVTAAQLGGPPTTTYVNAFLRLTVTPQITAENTIFLNVDVENTTPDFGHQVGGNPTLLTQQAVTSVLVNDGGTVVIGGVIQTQNSLSIQQVPLLGNIPILGNIFKRRAVSTQTQELIFFITPKIIQT